MPAPSPFRKYTAAFVAIAMLGSSAATAAPATSTRVVDPLVVVSVFGTANSRAAICAAGASASAAAATAAETSAIANGPSQFRRLMTVTSASGGGGGAPPGLG